VKTAIVQQLASSKPPIGGFKERLLSTQEGGGFMNCCTRKTYPQGDIPLFLNASFRHQKPAFKGSLNPLYLNLLKHIQIVAVASPPPLPSLQPLLCNPPSLSE